MIEGNLRKMLALCTDTGAVAYTLPVGEEQVSLAPHIGKPFSLHYTGQIHCIACGRPTRKSFGQGYCFPCVQSLAQCDICIVRPEKCHYHAGTCREPQWGEEHCFIPHYVYLANTSGLKVGITRHTQIPTRWLDQGATQALAIFRVNNRLQSGLVEEALKGFVADKTDWRKMLKGDGEPLDLVAARDTLLSEAADSLALLDSHLAQDAWLESITEMPVREFSYPVLEYPHKVSSFNFDKTPEVGGTLLGIKGQYLIFDGGVINMRKFAGYQVRVAY